MIIMNTDLIKIALDGKCETEDNYYTIRDNSFLRLFYTLKTIVCIILNRQSDGLLDEVTVAAYDFVEARGDEGSYQTWEELRVGYGFFSNWVFVIGDNASM